MASLFETYRRDAWGRPVGKSAGPDDKLVEEAKKEKAKPKAPPAKKRNAQKK